ncbi:MAG TPA: hypothetical protein VM571_03665 [Noviherbaspirillum sp.]|nr:hypothetical protein [Noviherbaspirillum sp.]
MFKRIFKRRMLAAGTVGAVVALSGCSGEESSKSAAIPVAFSPISSVMHDEAAVDSCDTTFVAMAERRHFDIYTRYRTMSAVKSSHLVDADSPLDGNANGASPVTGSHSGATLAACSWWTVLPQDQGTVQE